MKLRNSQLCDLGQRSTNRDDTGVDVGWFKIRQKVFNLKMKKWIRTLNIKCVVYKIMKTE